MSFVSGDSIIDFLKYLSDEYLLKILPIIIDYIDDDKCTYYISNYGKILEFTLMYQQVFEQFFNDTLILEGSIINQLSKSKVYFLKEIINSKKIDQDNYYSWEMQQLPLEVNPPKLLRKNLLNFINVKPIKYECFSGNLELDNIYSEYSNKESESDDIPF